MKNLFVLFIVFTVFLFSCEKSNNENLMELTQQSSVVSSQDEEIATAQEKWIAPPQNWKWRTFVFDNGQGKGVCNDFEGNCFPIDITIWGQHIRTMNSILIIISSGNQANIINAFLTNKAMLELYIDPTLVQGVINGTILVEVNFNGAGGLKFMIFRDQSGNIIAVYPLIC